MKPEEIVDRRKQIAAIALAALGDLEVNILANRLYPDGYICRRMEHINGQSFEISGPIVAATVEGGGTWLDVDLVPAVYYHVHITSPEDYVGRQSTYRWGIPDGKYETFWEDTLLNGAGDEVPSHPLPPIPSPLSDSVEPDERRRVPAATHFQP